MINILLSKFQIYIYRVLDYVNLKRNSYRLLLLPTHFSIHLIIEYAIK